MWLQKWLTNMQIIRGNPRLFANWASADMVRQQIRIGVTNITGHIPEK